MCDDHRHPAQVRMVTAVLHQVLRYRTATLEALPQLPCTPPLVSFTACTKCLHERVYPNLAYTPANATIFMTSVSVCAQQGQ